MIQREVQSLIDEAVKIATRAAVNGNPVARINWLPPMSASQDPMGNWIIEPWQPRSAGDTAPWEK